MKRIFTILTMLMFGAFSYGQTCVADFTYTVDTNTNIVTLTSQSYSGDSTLATDWTWTIMGGTLSGQTVTYNYTSLPLAVCLDVIFASSCTANTCDTIDVAAYDPCSGFSVNVNYDDVIPATCDGELTATVYGGTAPYSYNWSNSATTQVITGLCEGNYCLTVTDVNGCTVNDCGYVYADTSGGTIIDTLYNTALDTCIDFTITDVYVSNITLVDSFTVEVEWTFVGSGITQTVTETYDFSGAYGSYAVSISIDCGAKIIETWGEVIVIDNNTPTGINEIETLNNLKLYPNPVKDVLNIDFTITENNPVNIQIISYTGQVISNISVNPYAGSNSISISTSDLTSGVYFVRINNKTIKFIK